MTQLYNHVTNVNMLLDKMNLWKGNDRHAPFEDCYFFICSFDD